MFKICMFPLNKKCYTNLFSINEIMEVTFTSMLFANATISRQYLYF